MSEVTVISKFKRVEGIVCLDQTDGSLAVMSSDVEDYFFVVDGLAAQCLKQMDGQKSLSDIAKNVSIKNQAPVDLVQKDLLEFANSLLKEQIIEPCE